MRRVPESVKGVVEQGEPQAAPTPRAPDSEDLHPPDRLAEIADHAVREAGDRLALHGEEEERGVESGWPGTSLRQLRVGFDAHFGESSPRLPEACWAASPD